MTSLNTKRFLATSLLALFAYVCSATSVSAQPADPVEPVVEQPSLADEQMQLAEQALGQRDYAGATQYVLRAAQLEPNNPRYYRGLGRMAFYSEDYELSVYAFDLYLTHFREAAEAATGGTRLAVIEQERQEANHLRINPEAPVALPTPEQVSARQLVVERLETGLMMSLESSGAYNMYETLLRMNYVHPDLTPLQQELIRGILAETHAMFWPNGRAPIPTYTIEEWESVRRRYHAVERLGLRLLHEREVLARIAAADGQVFNINGSYDLAIGRFRDAVTANPNMMFSHWGLLVAEHLAASSWGEAADASWLVHLQALEDVVALQAPEYSDLIPLIEGAVYYDMGHQDVAAQALIELLAPNHRVAVPVLTPAAPAQPASQPTTAPTTQDPGSETPTDAPSPLLNEPPSDPPLNIGPSAVEPLPTNR